MQRTSIALLALATIGAPAAARADATLSSEAADITEVKGTLKLFVDARKHYVALVPFGGDMTAHVYYGDGKTFYNLRIAGGGASGTESFDRVFWDPRHGSGYQRSFGMHDNKYTVQCGERITALTPVADAAAAKMIASAKWLKPLWKHRAYALARDDEGNYFYVDKVREPDDSKSFRLYSGPKGKMAPMKMTNVVSDSEGDMFATKSGQLRLILGKNESSWVHSGEKTKLLLVPVEDNGPMIYSELGVYTGQPLGTPCDNL